MIMRCQSEISRSVKKYRNRDWSSNRGSGVIINAPPQNIYPTKP
jgi:hypothetical protein